MAIGWAFGGSFILPGTAQIYNGDYWKLPIIYAGMGGMIGGGVYFDSQFKKTGSESDKLARNLFFIGAAAFYWGQILDGAASYDSYRDHLPGRATIYSALLPGLGQIYNKEYWKLPIYYGGLAAAGYFWYYNDLQYKRFQKNYREATSPDGNYEGNLSVDNLQYYRDYYRRYRDYSAGNRRRRIRHHERVRCQPEHQHECRAGRNRAAQLRVHDQLRLSRPGRKRRRHTDEIQILA